MAGGEVVTAREDFISKGADAISDLLAMLGVDPDERPEHGGPSTAETLAAAVVDATGVDRLATQVEGVRDYAAICRRGTGDLPAADVWWKLNQITGAAES